MRMDAAPVVLDTHICSVDKRAHAEQLALDAEEERQAIIKRNAAKRHALERHMDAYDRVWRAKSDRGIEERRQAVVDAEYARQRADYADRRSLNAFRHKMTSSHGRESVGSLGSPGPKHPRPFLGTERSFSHASRTMDGTVTSLGRTLSTSSLMSNYNPPPTSPPSKPLLPVAAPPSPPSKAASTRDKGSLIGTMVLDGVKGRGEIRHGGWRS